MKVGDLVKDKTAKYRRPIRNHRFGIVTRPELGGWWVYWNCGAWGFHIQTDLEVVCK